MSNSKPNSDVEFISIGSNGITIDELLTEPISKNVKWLDRGLSLGDAGFRQPMPILKQYEALPDIFKYLKVGPIKADGLKNIHVLGCDNDGHQYYFGSKSERFYVLWRSPTEFEMVATTAKEFLQWVTIKRSDHLKGCPWEVFSTTQVYEKWLWPDDGVDPNPILEKAKDLFEWNREYVADVGFELLNTNQEIDLRLSKNLRGRKCYTRIFAKEDSPRIQEFLQWLEGRGFHCST